MDCGHDWTDTGRRHTRSEPWRAKEADTWASCSSTRQIWARDEHDEHQIIPRCVSNLGVRVYTWPYILMLLSAPTVPLAVGCCGAFHSRVPHDGSRLVPGARICTPLNRRGVPRRQPDMSQIAVRRSSG